MEEITINTHKLSIDSTGTTFHHDGRFFRAIKKEAQNDVIDLLNCGLIDELSRKKLFPKTTIADFHVNGYDLILEHERVHPVTYPFEWSFSMLKDAALCILQVVEISLKYGYGLHDLHNYNVIFEGCHPMFVDLGSLRKNLRFSDKIEQFIDYNFLPIKLFSMGEMTFAKRILADEYTERYQPYTYYHKSQLTEKLLRELLSGNFRNRIKMLLNYFGFKYKLSFRHQTVKNLETAITGLLNNNTRTQWGNYQMTCQGDGHFELTNRFRRIIEIINHLQVSEILDVGGNQGFLTRQIIENCPSVNKAVCIDYDENAIEAFYEYSKPSDHSRTLTPVHANILFPENVNYFDPFVTRMKSELVTALALTHHLILSQEFPVDFVFRQFRNLSTKYILVEFMPLGLWDGAGSPKTPDWYTIDWFRNGLMKHFDIINEEKLEENRILFTGMVKDSDVDQYPTD
jgi:hypothetical protein